MIHTLIKKLTLGSSVFICAILLLANILYIRIAYKNLEQQTISNFQTNIFQIYQDIEKSPILNASVLKQYTQNHYEIYLEDYETTLYYESDAPLPDPQAVIAELKKLSPSLSPEDRKRTSYIEHQEFFYQNGKKDYYVSTALIKNSDYEINAYILYSLADLYRHTRYIILQSCIICVSASLILCVFAYFLVRQSLKPVADSQRRQTEFIAAASHELRAPLTVIMSNTFAMTKTTGNEQRHYYEITAKECKRMSSMIENMLTLAHSDRFALQLNKSCCQPEDIVIDCYNYFEQIILAKHLKFHVSLPENALPPCLLDRNKILQLLIILIDNAVHYTETGSITLSLSRKNQHLIFCVIDTGIGIPDYAKGKIFDRFYRVDASHSDRTHHGLGLSVAKEIAQAHNGKIKVKDTPGGGSTFIVELKIM